MRFIVNIEKFEENDKKEPQIKIIERSDLKEIAWKINYQKFFDKVAEAKVLTEEEIQIITLYAKSVRDELFKKYPTTFKKAIEAMISDDVSSDELNKILDGFSKAENKLVSEATDKWYDAILGKKEIRTILVKLYAWEDKRKRYKASSDTNLLELLKDPDFYRYLDKNLETNPLLKEFYKMYKEQIDEGREKLK